MHKLLTALMVGVLGGLGVGLLVKLPEPPTLHPTTIETPSEKRQTLHVASYYPVATPLLGTRLSELENRLETMGASEFDVVVHDQSQSGLSASILEAVASGQIDAGWASPTIWIGRDMTFALFGAVPFGPEGTEFVSWLMRGGGLELMRALFAEHHVAVLPCGITPPRAGGWFRTPVDSVKDLKGMKIRLIGLSARVMEKLGVDAVRLPPGQVYYQLQQGTIDAAEYSFPVIDAEMGFYQIAKYYYFPGWQQQSSLLTLIINEKVWENMPERRRRALEAACGESIADSLADGAAAQSDVLADLTEKGVSLRRWPPEVLTALRGAWESVVAEEIQHNPSFKQGWESLSAFRARYRKWADLARLP